MTATELMRTSLLTVTPDAGCTSALRFLTTHRERASHVLVLDDGALTGAADERALRRASRWPTAIVRDVMMSPVYCIAPDTKAEDIVRIMDDNELVFVPVVSDRFLVGFVEHEDLVKHGFAPSRRAAPQIDQPTLAAN
jgi:CBS domain-containing protein